MVELARAISDEGEYLGPKGKYQVVRGLNHLGCAETVGCRVGARN